MQWQSISEQCPPDIVDECRQRSFSGCFLESRANVHNRRLVHNNDNNCNKEEDLYWERNHAVIQCEEANRTRADPFSDHDNRQIMNVVFLTDWSK